MTLVLTGLSLIITFTIGQLLCDVSQDAALRTNIVTAMITKGYMLQTGNNVITWNPLARDNNYTPFFNDGNYGFSFFMNSQPADRLGGRDIVLFRGCTPPQSTYFGFTAYSAATVTNNIPLQFETNRASIGDTVNHLVIKTEPIANNNSPFDRIASIATSGDQNSLNDLRNAYDSITGLSSSLINEIPIPIEANFAWSASVAAIPRDSYGAVIRIVNNEDVKEANQPLINLYMQHAQPLLIFRKTEPLPLLPILINLRDTKVSTNSPFENTESNRIAFENAVNAAKEYFVCEEEYKLISDTSLMQQRGSVPEQGGTDAFVYIFEHGIWCLDNDNDCIGDNRDTHYSWDAIPYTLSDNDLYIVIGLNHNNFDMSIYNSFGIYYVNNPNDASQLFAPIPVGNNGIIIDDLYEKFDINDAIESENIISDAFIASVSRPKNCLDESMATLCPNTDILADNEAFVFFARAHLNPHTATMPNEEQLIPWRVLRFRLNVDSSETESQCETLKSRSASISESSDGFENENMH